ncbi:MAG: alpha-ribazole phosphatase [Actinobacteria bacterium]|nr:alpha-ribazole phosphatase [Actinomycetota bacterium]MBM3713888.1 alpha-ribazole phosphatase [Actinomycetota bacterium]
MGVKLFLIRHGQTESNARGIYQGTMDTELTEEGMEQAKLAKEYLSNVTFSNIYSSPKKRALDTAKIIAENTGLEIKIRKDLEEMNFGKWEGLKFEDINTQYKKDYQNWLADPFINPPPGGESFGELIARASEEINRIVAENPERSNVLVVTHGGLILALIVKWLKIPSECWRSLIQRQGAINVVVIDKGFPYISSINYTGHIKPVYDDREDRIIEIYSKIKEK